MTAERTRDVESSDKEALCSFCGGADAKHKFFLLGEKKTRAQRSLLILRDHHFTMPTSNPRRSETLPVLRGKSRERIKLKIHEFGKNYLLGLRR